MMILKSETFSSDVDLVVFVNENDILRENILTITRTPSKTDWVSITLYYYEEGIYVKREKEIKIEIKEKKDTWF
ncbi:hypothetical protein GCM10027049_21880 [Mucilaginibacter puniceus]